MQKFSKLGPVCVLLSKLRSELTFENIYVQRLATVKAKRAQEDVDGLKESASDMAMSVRNLEQVIFLKSQPATHFALQHHCRANFWEFPKWIFSKHAQDNAEILKSRVYVCLL